MLITSFGDGPGSKLKAVKQLAFEVTLNRVTTQAPGRQLPDRANPSFSKSRANAGRGSSLQVGRAQKRIHETQANDPAVEIVEEISAPRTTKPECWLRCFDGFRKSCLTSFSEYSLAT